MKYKIPDFPDHNERLNSISSRIIIFNSISVIAVAIMGLLGYLPKLGYLSKVSVDYIPMAPTTAVCFFILGGILFFNNSLKSSTFKLKVATFFAVFVSLFSILEIVGFFTGLDLNLEDMIVPDFGYLGNIPIARMSPATAAVFCFSSFALAIHLKTKTRTERHRNYLYHIGGIFNNFAFITSLIFCFYYVYGNPLLYGNENTVPMALTTAIAFFFLGCGVFGAYGKHVFPISLMMQATNRIKKFTARKKFYFLALIMIVNCSLVAITMTFVLYRHEILEQKKFLSVIVQTQSKLIKSVSSPIKEKKDLLKTGSENNRKIKVNLNFIIESLKEYKNFGKTGELTLARREGDYIVFILSQRNKKMANPEPVKFDSNLAEPMRKALGGFSGTMIAYDYQGVEVIAAFESLGGLNLGIVAKIDISEVRAPFIRSGIAGFIVTGILVFFNMIIFFSISNPMVKNIENYSKNIQKEMTERKFSEKAFHRSEQNFRKLLENLPLAICYVSKEGDITFRNNKFIEKLGYTENDVTNLKDLWEIVYPDEKYREKVRGNWNLSVQNASHSDKEIATEIYNITCKNEEVKNIQISGVTIEENFLVTFIDVTEKKKLEKEREQLIKNMEQKIQLRTSELDKRVSESEKLNRAMLNLLEDMNASKKTLEITLHELEKSNYELETFSYSVSHDLRAPLRAINGFVNILIEDYSSTLGQEGQRICDVISVNAVNMGQLIDDLLKFSRLGRSSISISTVNMEVIIDSIYLNLTELAERKRINFECKSLPNVNADLTLIKQVWANLIGNAIKYSSNRKLSEIKIWSEENEDEIIYSISDNGAGFDMKYKDKLFGVFQRLHNVKEFAGTGVGLAIVNRIIKLHDGRVWGEGEVDKGAVFHFTLNKGEIYEECRDI